VKTVKDFRQWKDIETKTTIPIFKLLKPDIQTQIEELENRLLPSTSTPLIGRFVESTEVANNHDDEAGMDWLRVYAPNLGPPSGWYSLGQRLGDDKSLIVRERPKMISDPTDPALGEINDAELFADNTGQSGVPRWYSWWRLVAAKPAEYAAIGDYFHASKISPHDPGGKPDVRNIRAVRRDLLVSGAVGVGGLLWTNLKGKASVPIALQEIRPKPGRETTTICTGNFRAMKADLQSSLSRLLPGGGEDDLYMLRTDKVTLEA